MPYKDREAKRDKDKQDYLKMMHGSSDALRCETVPRELSRLKPMVTRTIKGPAHGLKIAVIPDVQSKAGVPTGHLACAGKYLALKRPDVIVCIGDFADMPSLSHYDVGKRSFEGRRYRIDVDAARKAMSILLAPIMKVSGWRPELILTLGNHESRIDRTTQEEARMEGLISIEDLKYSDAGWTVYPFMQPVVIGGVAFCHFFPSGVMGKPITTAKSLLNKLHMSAFAGHQQGRDIAYSRRADGGDLTAIISGSFYEHDEDYLTPFTNNHWRGMWMLHEVKDGSYDEMAISLNYLKRRFA